MLRGLTWAAPLLLALAAGGCTMQGASVDPKLAPELAYIKIVGEIPSGKCRYLGDLVSFRALVSKVGLDVFHVEESIKETHDLELRQRARQLGANVIFVPFSQDNGFAYLVQINTFHAC